MFSYDSDLVFAEATLLHESGVFSKRLVASSLRVGSGSKPKVGGIQNGVLMTGEEWSRAMRAIWLLNTIEVEMSHLGIPLMRVPSTLRALGDTLAQANMSEQDGQLIEDELTRAHASFAQAVGELQAGMTEIESLLGGQTLNSFPQHAHETTTTDVSERERSVVWQK